MLLAAGLSLRIRRRALNLLTDVIQLDAGAVPAAHAAFNHTAAAGAMLALLRRPSGGSGEEDLDMQVRRLVAVCSLLVGPGSGLLLCAGVGGFAVGVTAWTSRSGGRSRTRRWPAPSARASWLQPAGCCCCWLRPDPAVQPGWPANGYAPHHPLPPHFNPAPYPRTPCLSLPRKSPQEKALLALLALLEHHGGAIDGGVLAGAGPMLQRLRQQLAASLAAAGAGGAGGGTEGAADPEEVEFEQEVLHLAGRVQRQVEAQLAQRKRAEL